MIIAIISLLVVITIFLLAIRLAAMAMILTGMSQESARFQALSALAGVGFTTKESESVISHPVRRRIIKFLMLGGNIGVPAVVATIVVSFLTTARAENWWWPVLILVVGLTGLTILARSKYTERHLNTWLTWALKKWTDLDARDYISLLQLQNGYAVTELFIEPGDWLDEKTLSEAALSKEGVLVLGIQYRDGTFIGTPRAIDIIQSGDTLVLYGRIDRLRELDQRGAAAGETAHQEAVAEQTTLNKTIEGHKKV
ncbi:MAG: TrkA C-terminal domain-containing protein [Bacteroidales bacterium]|nr:TrkA C-terminal domain-containing protein [Bacteroidales bacterium]MDZ4204404.1 TrkA C-terminal domain-containing protein [Bacteroidales bacterium]